MPQKLPNIFTVIVLTSVFGRLRDLQYIFAVIYETLCILEFIYLNVSFPGSNTSVGPKITEKILLCNGIMIK